MSPAEMVKASAAEGMKMRLTPQGGISLKGDSEAVSRWSAVLKSRKSDLVAYLSTETSVTDWLDRIGEDDPAVIGEVLCRCRNDREALSYFLWRAKGVGA